MFYVIPLLAQGNPGAALIEIAVLAGFVVVPVAIIAWTVWARKGRPRSVGAVAGLVLVSAAFVVWAAACVAYYMAPSPEEENAVEEVEAAYPILDTSSWSYSAKHPSPDVWIITVEGHRQGRQPISKKWAC